MFTDSKPNSNALEYSLENSELDLASNLSSSTEKEIEEKEPIRRSKRLTKLIQLLDIITQFAMITGNTVKLGGHSESTRSRPGE